MNHRKSGKKFRVGSAYRTAMFRNLAVQLVMHEQIKTTLIKAKELRRFLEPLITRSASDSVAGRRFAFAKLRDKAAVAKLFTDLGPRFKSRPGGYMRVLKCGHRAGDAAPMAFAMLLEDDQKTTS